MHKLYKTNWLTDIEESLVAAEGTGGDGLGVWG